MPRLAPRPLAVLGAAVRATAALAAAALAACGNPAAPAGDAVILRAITPARGSITGGTRVVLDGEGFTAAASRPTVVIGGRPAAHVEVLDDYTIVAETPAAAAAGPTDVIAAGDAGWARLDLGFTYNAPPAITAVAPSSGPIAGGTALTITGSGFTAFDAGAPTLTIGGVAATDVAVVSDTELTATAPPGPPLFAAPVALVNANGPSTGDATFFYRAHGLVTAGAYAQPATGLYFVDPASGLVDEVMPLELDHNPVGIEALAAAADGNTIWAATYGQFPPQLLAITLQPPAVTDVGELFADYVGQSGTSGGDIQCADLEVVAGKLYCAQAQYPSPALYTIDTTTGHATRVAPIASYAGIADVGGVAYATVWSPAQVGRIDLTTGAITDAVTYSASGPYGTTGLDGPTGLDGAIYAIDAYPSIGPEGVAIPVGGYIYDHVFALDPTTGTCTLVTGLSFSAVALTHVD